MDRITRTVADCFGAVIHLRRAEASALPEPEQIHRRLRAFVDRMLKRAAEEGFNHQDAQDLAYAVVALLDEVAIAQSDAMRDFWMSQTLQFQYFKENRAGEGFFKRLEAIRVDPNRRDVLRVYYLCLVLGFQGRYRVRGGELELMQLTDTLARDLAHGAAVGTDTLSPHGERPPESLRQTARKLPLVAFSAGALAFALLVYTGLRIAISSEASALVETVSTRAAP
ncbi:MAG TPA: DotU family type IV/VI secretion system protein [Myxococcaceae bacterium]|nr:DotU family type IV/VI secretion system protein [Myxococcaceae bacterium]